MVSGLFFSFFVRKKIQILNVLHTYIIHMLKKHPVYLCSYIHVVMYTVCTVLTGLYLRQGRRNQGCRGGGGTPHPRVLLKQWLILLVQKDRVLFQKQKHIEGPTLPLLAPQILKSSYGPVRLHANVVCATLHLGYP